MTLLADLLSTVLERRLGMRAKQPPDDRAPEDLAAALMSSTGEVTGLTLARQILENYRQLDDEGRLTFFRHVAREMGIDPVAVRAALDAYEANPGKASYRAFASAAEPPRQEFFRRLNQVPGATAALVAMRADLLRLGRDDPDLAALDLDIRHLFASWFNRGFLVLRPINWESPAHILEKIIAYEAVHAINSWQELRQRLAPSDRRCFAFFHPAMPDEPLIFVEVALTRGVPGSIQSLLSEDRAAMAEDEADTAVFYSISNCQAGLANISFGNSLIKQVASDLSAELPGLKVFVTLSPIPGLAAWMEENSNMPDPHNPDALRALAACYLTRAKRPDGQPRDPVARFHLGNGATVHNVHAGADLSPKGLAQSAGAMVNYLYDLSKVTRNVDAYAEKRSVAAASEVRNLAATVDLAVDEDA